MDILSKWLHLQLIESPARFDAFKSKVDSLSWQEQSLPDSLDCLFYAVDDLAKAEIDYYYKRRKKWAQMSGICRSAAWFFGSIGILTPLIEPLNLFSTWIKPQHGYFFLAIAGIFLAANSLFNWTQGHIRYLKAQLSIESLVTTFRIKWCENLALLEAGTADLSQSFAIISSYSEALHTAVLSESGEWGEAILAELQKFEKRANKNGGG